MREMPQDRQEPMSPHIAQEPIVAVVVPCYNEEAVLEHTHKALSHKLASLIDSRSISTQSFICYVDDGSRDRTWEILCDLVDSSVDSKETSANAERYPLFSKEAMLCHADFQSARNDSKTQNLNSSAQDSKIAELESGLLDSRQTCSRLDLGFSLSAWDSRIVDEKGLLCERSQGRILGVCNCSEREAIKPLSLQAESINSSPPPPRY